MEQLIKIIITDDHSMIREGLRQLLELEGDIQVIGEAKDGLECLQLMEELTPDVILLDINMPNMNGLKMLETLRENGNEQKILMLTIHNEVEYLLRAMEIGANGYVLKDSDSMTLKKAIVSIYNGETYIDAPLVPLMRERLADKEKRNQVSAEEILTKRELEVLKLLAEGLFNKEIAYQLSISEKTVKNHVSNIFKKIEVSDRTQAAVYAIKNNVVDLL